ncbi:16S rRNA (uracil(1498)-N(3))-methyltransferase [Ramlibacter sp.]|uniref:16S rRNA (uracil(1498)-N(3))-methyltransferase n=1 Tax=Ramlibacter sp. TaxID=1917967 RepID=UPI002D104776|nr:16S rRNA (uracil(1498)-N(3))-methyltransferase [Ramlibacter sp.]HWI80481.1 16S rRNA (uracil(1498)-N(3))-methyltransferase [Ramlibacter sp.]
MPSAASEAARGPRFHCPGPLAAQQVLALPAGAARHVQVLRLQPGAPITLFDGNGGEWRATVQQMGRSEVAVRVDAHVDVEREAGTAVHLAVGIPANERMDWLVEKATELGAASIQPLVAQRSVVRLSGERAQRKQAHWQAIAIAACEQCGRNRVPPIHAPLELADWLQRLAQEAAAAPGHRWLLSLESGAQQAPAADEADTLTLLSGPEGGLAPAEEAAARAAGFLPRSLGPRVLRAETAPLAALARWAR